MEMLAFLSETIHAYTGLSPAAFITILSLMIGAYFLVSSCFVHPDSIAATEKSAAASTPDAPADQTPSPPPALMAEPVQMGEMTLEELREYNGSDRNKPLLVSIKGDVYNVSRGCPISDITVDLRTTKSATAICITSSGRYAADDVATEKVHFLMRRLAMAREYSRSVIEQGGFYGNMDRERERVEIQAKNLVHLNALSLRKLKAMYREKLRHLQGFS